MTGNGTKFGCRPIECADNTCFPGVECVDSAAGFQCGSCPDGYKGNGSHCTDIDEVLDPAMQPYTIYFLMIIPFFALILALSFPV